MHPNIRAFLASNLDFTGAAIRALLPLNGARVLLVPTATYGEGRHLNPDEQAAYEAAGAQVQIHDLAHTESLDACAALLATTDIVHLCGGNTFALLAALQRSQFAQAIEARAAHRPIAVVGESAGAIVFGTDIAHIAPLDDPSVAPHIPTTGLGWIDARLVPHYKAESWGFGTKIDAWLATDPQAHTYTLLRDTQALVRTPQGWALLEA